MLEYIEKNFKYELRTQTTKYQVYTIFNEKEKYLLKVLVKGEYHLNIIKLIDNIHIPKIKKVFEEKDYIYVIQEYFEGIPIYKLADISEDRLIEYILQICDGLNALHLSNLAYKNLKLSSLIITDNDILMLDGCENAKIIGDGSKKQDTRYIGDIGFAAPEQFISPKNDIRSDIYSIGVLMRAVLDSIYGKEYDGKYNYIIEKCLEYNPDYRFQKIEELKEEIKNGYILEKEEQKNNYTFGWKIYYFICYYIVALTFFFIGTYHFFHFIDSYNEMSDISLYLIMIVYVFIMFAYPYFTAKKICKFIKYQYMNRNRLKVYIYIVRLIPFILIIYLCYRRYMVVIGNL